MVSAACRDLLLDAGRFSAKFGDGFFNHLPMALVALDRLGGDEARLRAFFDSYAKQLRPKSAKELALRESLHGQSVADVVPQLGGGVASQAFHGLIRVAYAVDAGVDEDMADALAGWKTGYSELPDDEPHFESFADALEALVVDERLPREIDVSGISGRIANVVRMPAFARYRVAQPALPEIAVASARIYVATGDFTALHMVTGSHAMRVLGSLLDARALRVFATAILAAYVTIGRPPMAVRIPDDLPSEAEIAARAVASDDDHDLKMVYSSLREEEHYRTGWHRAGAALRAGLP